MTREARLLLASVLRHIRETLPFQSMPYRPDECTQVSFDADGISIRRRSGTAATWPDFPDWSTRYTFRTVTEGVDIAVAIGLLPVDFSSAYEQGLEDAHSEIGDLDDEAPIDDVAELFRITANLDTPHEPYLECRRCEDHVASLNDHDVTEMTSLLDAMRNHFEMYHAHEVGEPS